MAKTKAQIIAEAQVVKNATEVGENTATRVGGVLEDLAEKINEYISGRFYGYSATSADLPEGDEVGYAYVGNSPFEIWNFNGTTWSDSGVTIANAPVPDMEDIDYNATNELQFASRVYNSMAPDGLGYKILRKSNTFAAQATEANTIYEVRYDFDLNGQAVNLPAGSVLKFEGGSFNNGTLNGNNTTIEAGSVKIFGNNLSVSGSFTGDFNFFWLGAKAGDSSFDNSPILQRWWDSFANYGFGKLFSPKRAFYFSTPIAFSQNRTNIYIDFGYSTLYATLQEGETFLDFTPATGYNENFIFRNAIIRSTSLTSGTTGIRIKTSNLWTLGNIQIWSFDTGMHLTDVYYGTLDGMCSIRGCRIGMKTTGGTSNEVNTIDLRNLKINSCTVEEAKALIPQNDGESETAWAMRWARCGIDAYTSFFTAKFNGMTIESTDYGIRLNYVNKASTPAGTVINALTISECYFENISTYSIYQGYGNLRGEYPTGNSYMYHVGRVNICNCRFTSNNIRVATGDWSIYDNQPINLRVVSTGYALNVSYDNSVSINTDDWGDASNVVLKALDFDKMLNTQKNTALNGSSPVIYFDSMQQAIYRNFLPKLITKLRYGTTWAIKEIRGLLNVSSDATLRFTDTFKPTEVYADSDIQAATLTGKTAIINSNKKIFLPVHGIVRNVAMPKPLDMNVLPFYTLIRYMKAGVTWEGYTNMLFPNDKLIVDTTNHVVRYTSLTGKIAIYDVAYLATHSSLTGIYSGLAYNADTGYITEGAYNTTRRIICDVVMGCMTLPGSDEVNNNYQNISAPSMNAIRVSRTAGKAYIYNGTAWVELTDYKTRYEYPYHGASLSERVKVPYLVGETYVNNATGIEYIYTSSGWKASNQPTGVSANISSSEVQAGDSIFDTTLGYPVWWNGSAWVNATGIAV